jgi:hypothetical protein
MQSCRRFCAEAKYRQTLVAQRVAVSVEEATVLEEIGQLALKGLTQLALAFQRSGTRQRGYC